MDFTPVAANTHTVYSDNPTRPANGSFKKNPSLIAPQSPSMVVSSSFKECLKNHAASIGGHALDGCSEFMPSLSSNPADPSSLKCAACGCHRNFHRRDPQQEQPQFLNCFYSPPWPAPPHRSFGPRTSPSPNQSPSTSPMSSPSSPPLSHFPPPLSSFPSAGVAVPNMLLALGTSYSGRWEEHHRSFNSPATATANPTGKKRCRTKFSPEQKQKMYAFSEKLGWKMRKVDDGLIQEFCNEIGVSRVVFKVWMHNHKNAFRTRRSESENNNNNNTGKVNEDEDNGNNGGGGGFDSDIYKNPAVNSIDLHASSINGSSSS